jgi:CheY-like chemotaxis protein/HPt (histidine-containing phosphotransfer) domain-containing protein
LLNLINDILDFSKIEAGKLEMETLSFDLLSMLDDFAASLAMHAYGKGVEFLCAVDPGIPALLRGDPGRLRQVLTNLAGNAIKFTQQGEVVVRVTCLSETEQQVELRFSIRDTGIGIPPDKLGLLFDKFSQVDASTTRQFGGTGLGLAISKQLVELMGGQIGVNSAANRGSEFWFSVFLTRQPEILSDNQSENLILSSLKDIRILVVDDNSTSREILSTQLTSVGMRPSEAPDGLTALQTLVTAGEQGAPFQIAILDMQLPDKDGAALGLAIKNDPRLSGTRLVLLSALGEYSDVGRFAEIGFTGYLAKPWRHADLFIVLANALTGSSALAEFKPSIHKAQRAQTGSGKRILLVEDNSTNQMVALEILKKVGLKAESAINGVEALTALENNPYDLILMDVQMPEMDGIETTRHIRDHQSAVLNHNIPVIAMTANVMRGDRERCLEAGMNDYISKPFELQALLEVLRRWLPDETNYKQASAQASAATLLPKTIEPRTAPAAVFDKAGLMQRLLDDDQLMQLVLASFLKDIPLQIQALKDFLEAGDTVGAGRQAHTIKGASANISAEALRAIAAEMEIYGKSGDLDAIRKHISELETQFGRLREVLEKEI